MAQNRNEGGGTGALGLAGDFKTFDTASVLKADLGRLTDLSPTAGRRLLAFITYIHSIYSPPLFVGNSVVCQVVQMPHCPC